jgi:hypothetical protein
VPQLKMRVPDAELERYARTGATMVIVEERKRHAELDRRFPGILAEAIRTLRANGNGHHQVKAAAPAEEPKRRTMSAAARKRISMAQKARWRKQRKEAKAS